MRIRKKKHLTERLQKVNDYLIIADTDVLNSEEAIKDKNLLDYEKLFGNTNPIEIEIGCGKGGFIIEKAKRNPNTNFIAVELLQNIIVMAAEQAAKEGLKNLLFFNCGADYLGRYIAAQSISAVYLNFSPPYSGKRYENRRLTKDLLIEAYKGFLVDGGVVCQKTDDKEFFDYSYAKFEEHGFITETVDLNTDDNAKKENVQTEYEKKFREKGLNIYCLKAIKNRE